MIRLVVALMMLAGSASPVCGAQMDALRPTARWLATERLRGTLFHNPLVEPLRPVLVAPVDPAGRSGAPVSIALRGWHHVIVLPDKQGKVVFRLKDLPSQTHFQGSLYAVFDPQGSQIAEGTLRRGEEKVVEVAARAEGPHVVLLNSGPASSSAVELTVLNPHWAIDGTPRTAYNRSPLHYHFLRDLKLGGFNLALIDFERLPQDFATDEGLAAWTEAVKRWTDYARECRLRVMPVIDLGGTPREVEAWGDSPKGLYIEHDPEKPLAPCPLQKVYWERILLRRGRQIARLSLDNPYVVGYGIDPEMYQCWLYGHYMLSGTCFCDHCLGGFFDAKKLDRAVLAQTSTGKDRYQWLTERKLMDAYYDYLTEQMTELATWCREDLHRISPDLLFDMFVIDIGNWFCEGIARGLGRPDLPVVNFCEHTYYSVGYDREWLDKTHQRFRGWGANVLQGSALWDVHFPPTKPGFLAAHAYNLAVRDEGWLYWPGDELYRDYGSRFAYLNEPAYFEDYWDACTWANREIAATAAEPGRESPLDAFEVVPWKGKIQGGVPKAPAEIMRSQPEPGFPIRVASPTTLYFTVPERAEDFEVIVQARGDQNAASVTVREPDGGVRARTDGELDTPDTLAVKVTRPGTWSVDIARGGDTPLRDVGLRFEHLPSLLSPSAATLLVSPAKKPGLIGYWSMDEGEGTMVADTSRGPAYNGTMRDATWGQGEVGACLNFDGREGEVLIPAEYSYHNLKQFSLSAWVKLKRLPVQGNGRTIVNKGPEAPVQHFWWWIGYPPSHPLILEMGDQNRRWGTSFGTGRLEWTIDRWYHVAVVFQCDGKKSTVTHYRDGRPVGGSTRDEAFHSGSYDLKIGSYGGLHWMDGSIDEVKLWDRPLTADEVLAEYKRPAAR